ncbi:Cytosine/adenosine deaminase [Candidatus Kryptonium thompsonii]|uniref:Cytosine/adenosine deaminase n=2 Tax=Candidatus Kryptonium thompsonii TaxID=1633631 RepID=A0ABP2AWT2_9BACT|nr:amidohydrolase family protein [Candidatus Kryptonium thompsoni]CUS77964.1 Cytosine/adenosine deaminase [Candidatus Kryptonium thompsoni]CUS81838.1 Cytosine/adenosine deaminase [Candidatus Kryptonium thompsoni]CUS83701.1 Cytosine/adenosine deaminase [Candidatus Kryptonium thompsoni]CUS85198.1 Cytosine/adenosine deaminase [Candidatus Kryptonium thompsoni]CUS87692.1 Cytosine/adenosine deaminase [Candidatus Kryptonium thompsoni]
MKIFYAKYILPIASEIIEDGAIVVDGNKIVDFGNREEINSKFKDVERKFDLKNALIMPGFVNAHTHLELSGIKIKEVKDFKDWLYQVVEKRRKLFNVEGVFGKIKLVKTLLEKRWKGEVEKRIGEMVNSGTVAVGDVSNTGRLITMLLRVPMKVQIFIELISFVEERGIEFFNTIKELVGNVNKVVERHNLQREFRISLAPHAPYSVSEALFKLIKNFNGTSKTSVHLAEVIDEVEFIKNGTGFFRTFLIQRNGFDYSWNPPGVSPVKYLDRINFLDENTLAVHCVNVDDEDIEILSERNVSVCTCPRSNFFLKVGKAPVRKFLDHGINVCMGTDSMASNRDLNILNELKFAREFYENVSDEELLKIATLNGAKALGFDNICGSIERGKDSDLIYFIIPSDLKKSEIYKFIFRSNMCSRLR